MSNRLKTGAADGDSVRAFGIQLGERNVENKANFTGEGIMSHTHTVEYYSAVKMKAIKPQEDMKET